MRIVKSEPLWNGKLSLVYLGGENFKAQGTFIYKLLQGLTEISGLYII